jgi:hypothetical protein
MPNPPDRWTYFSTAEITTKSEMGSALNGEAADGYNTVSVAVPSSVFGITDGSWTVAVGGYSGSDSVNVWQSFSTASTPTQADFVTALNNLASKGYYGPAVAMPNALFGATDGSWTVFVGGYSAG